MLDKIKQNKIIKLIVIPIVIAIVSFVCGIIFNDYILGFITLASGFLNAYYMAIGRWENYIYGFIFSFAYSIVCAINGLYGFAIFTILVYTPLQIYGIINWKKNKVNDEVRVKSLNWKKSLLLTSIIIIGSCILGYLLSLIPTQRLSYIDATSQVINIGGCVLNVFRFREAWYIWVINNAVDLAIWIVNSIAGGSNVPMMLITSIMYFVMNVYGLIAWIYMEKKQKLELQNKKTSEDI